MACIPKVAIDCNGYGIITLPLTKFVVCRKRLEKEIQAREMAEQKVRDLEARLQLATVMMNDTHVGHEEPNFSGPVPKVFVSETIDENVPFVKATTRLKQDQDANSSICSSKLATKGLFVSPIVPSQSTHEPVKMEKKDEYHANSPRLTSVRSIASPQFDTETINQQAIDRITISPIQLASQSASSRKPESPTIVSVRVREPVDRKNGSAMAVNENSVPFAHLDNVCDNYGQWSNIENSTFSFSPDAPTCSPTTVSAFCHIAIILEISHYHSRNNGNCFRKSCSKFIQKMRTNHGSLLKLLAGQELEISIA